VLGRLEPGEGTELALARLLVEQGHAKTVDAFEGKADVVRAIAPRDAVALDVPDALGTSTIALARGAAHVVAVCESEAHAGVLVGRSRAEGLDNVTCVVGVPPGWDEPVFDIASAMPAGTLAEIVSTRAASAVRPGGVLIRRPGRGARSRRRGSPAQIVHALPSSADPRIAAGRRDLAAAVDLYARHVLQARSSLRRIVGRGLRAMPGWLLPAIVPAHAEVVGGRPRTLIMGSPDREGSLKTIDWDNGVLRSVPRMGGREQAVPLEDGWIARTWIEWPVSRRGRARRRAALLSALTSFLEDAARGRASAEQRSRWQLEAAQGLAILAGGLSRATADTLGQIVRDAGELSDLLVVEEHGDLFLKNVIVAEGERVVPIDAVEPRVEAIAGRDAVCVVMDALSLGAGTPSCHMGTGLAELAAARGGEAELFGNLLRTGLGTSTADHAARIALLGVLRQAAGRGPVLGTAEFLEAAVAGQLARSLERVGFSAESDGGASADTESRAGERMISGSATSPADV